MARTDGSVQYHRSTGIDITWEAAHVDGNMFINDGKAVLLVRNDSGGAITVTVQTPQIVDGDLAVGERVITVNASTYKAIGFLNPNVYNQASGVDAGKVYIDFSAQASITFAVLHQ